jgi:ABC-type molybdenum transport system ATPase subunit/photorepair protein PhrA
MTGRWRRALACRPHACLPWCLCWAPRWRAWAGSSQRPSRRSTPGWRLPASAGSITLLGQTVARLSTAARAQLGLARTYQIVRLFGRDNLLHNVKLALLGKSPLRHRHWGSFDQEKTLSALAIQVLDSVGLGDKADWPLEQTSYGEKRHLEIAMALAQNPRVLLLDEPLAGLSPASCSTARRSTSSRPSASAGPARLCQPDSERKP